MNEELFTNTPPELHEQAKNISNDLLPRKSRERYTKCYELFNTWRKIKKAKNLTENVLLAYLLERSKTFGNICEKDYSRKGRITSLKNHLKSKHTKMFEELEKRIAENAEQGQPACSTSTDTGSNTKQLSLQEYLTKNVCWDLSYPKSKETDRLIGEMIALEDLPFNFVEGVGFRRLINTILPRYKLRGRQFFTSLLSYFISLVWWNSTFYMLERFVKIKDSLLLYLSTKQFVSFSPDDLSTVDLLLKLLAPFEELTKELSNSKNSISMVIPLTHVILTTLKAAKDNQNTPEKVKALFVKVIREISERFGDLNKNLLCSVSTKRRSQSHIVNLCQNQTIHENKDCSAIHKKRKIDNQIATSSSSCSMLLQSVQSILSSSESEAEYDQLTTLKLVLQNYVKERRLSLEEDPLMWWRQNGYKYIVLLPIVRQYLSTPPSSFTSEQLFSGASLIYEKASKLLFFKYNLPVINYECEQRKKKHINQFENLKLSSLEIKDGFGKNLFVA
nr:zinc finger BED domain-containing protein 4-like [Onthophagus taurus]